MPAAGPAVAAAPAAQTEEAAAEVSGALYC